MATYYSSRYALKEGGTATTASHWIEQNAAVRDMGQVVFTSGLYTFTGGEATNDTVILFSQPLYSKLLTFTYWNDDCGTTVTTDLEAITTDMKANIALGTVATDPVPLVYTSELVKSWAVFGANAGNVRLNFTSVSTPTAGAIFYFAATWARGTSIYG